MIKENESETKCYFCEIDKIRAEDRIIIEKNEWYAFVPQDPEIFGHVIVTYRTDTDSKYPHIQNISCDNEKRIKILNILDVGVKTIVDGLKNIKNVEMVYFAMLGETIKTHMHYHLFPRYGFVNDSELLLKLKFPLRI